MIIGTAGHIDHGKTTLVKALTGVNTDRLKEEKERGISIELGYAYTPLDNGDVLGIIDVPGHEKFVHTMAAGAAGIDHALLVIAADDGVMPQTREHLNIVELLGVHEGTVALTKADRAAPERIAEVRAELKALLAGTPLADAPVFETAATQADDPGVAALKAHLFARAQNHPARRDEGLFRLAIDRVFTLSGQGTIVTGTVFSGTVKVGDTLQHSATKQPVRIRSIHAQNRDSDTGRAGQRVALNLAGIEKDAMQRGDWIADPKALQATRRMDVQLQLLPDAELKQWAAVHVHLGAAHHLAHVVPLDPGLAQLVFDADVFATAGDRLIVRNAQATRTLGGGTVLDPYAPERKRRSEQRMAYLDAIRQALQSNDFAPLLDNAPQGLARSRMALLFGLPPKALNLPADAMALPLNEDDALLIAPTHWQRWQTQVRNVLERFHAQSPDEPGVNAARLRRMALPGLVASEHDGLWQGLLTALLQDGTLAQTGAWLHLPTHRVTLSDAEQALAEKLLPAIHEGCYDPPWVRDLAQDFHVGEEVARQLLRKLARQGLLHQVVKDLFYSAERMAELAALMANDGTVPIEAAQFRDATGLGRKRAIQVLEYFDRIGYTRRVKDAHLLRPGVHWGNAH